MNPAAGHWTADDVRVEIAGPQRWVDLRDLRLRALADSPDAFGQTYEVERTRPDAVWRSRLERPDRPVLLVWVGSVPPSAPTGPGRRPAAMAILAPPQPTVGRPDVDGVLGVYSVYVDRWARGRGVGSALLSAAIARARSTGAARLVLNVGDHNLAAQALYHRVGFEPTGRLGRLPPPRQHVTEHELALDL